MHILITDNDTKLLFWGHNLAIRMVCECAWVHTCAVPYVPVCKKSRVCELFILIASSYTEE